MSSIRIAPPLLVFFLLLRAATSAAGTGTPGDCVLTPVPFPTLGLPTLGISWVDYDTDGDADLYLTRVYFPNELHRNDGGAFVFSGVDTLGMDVYELGSTWGDYDRDGDPDVYVVGGEGDGRLFRNDGRGTFADVTSASVPPTALRGRDAAWVDFDNDGLLDLYLTTIESANVLYRNAGDGTLVDVSAMHAPLAEPDPCGAAAWCDYDWDGDPDVYLAIRHGPNKLIRNDGVDGFLDVTPSAMADEGYGQGVSWADYDNDLDFDLYLCNADRENRLYRNDGAGSFVDVATGPLAAADSSQSGAWADVDNDRDLDLVLTNLSQLAMLLRNDGSTGFAPLPLCAQSPTDRSGGAAWADSDDDGDLDLALSGKLNVGLRLYRNDLAPDKHSIRIRLVGRRSNPSAIGARVILTVGGVKQLREVGTGNGLTSESSPIVHFGLGDATAVERIRVEWPSGLRQDVRNVHAADRTITIVEGRTKVSVVAPWERPAGSDASASPVPEHVPATGGIVDGLRAEPNPGLGRFRFAFSVDRVSRVTGHIFDPGGRRLRTLVDRVFPRGQQEILWDGKDELGRAVPTGVYFVRFQADGEAVSRKFTLLR